MAVSKASVGEYVEYTTRVLSRLRRYGVKWECLSREQRADVTRHIADHIAHNHAVTTGTSGPFQCAYSVRDTARGIAARLAVCVP